jgi:hypothetical protein
MYRKNGKMHRQGEIEWLNEGMAESISLGLAKSWEYPHETRVVLRVLKAVGNKRALRRAFYSGDFTRVQKRVDSEYGEGSFEQVVASKSAGDALQVLRTNVARKQDLQNVY